MNIYVICSKAWPRQSTVSKVAYEANFPCRLNGCLPKNEIFPLNELIRGVLLYDGFSVASSR